MVHDGQIPVKGLLSGFARIRPVAAVAIVGRDRLFRSLAAWSLAAHTFSKGLKARRPALPADLSGRVSSSEAGGSYSLVAT